jgi:hypothetical protein
MAMNLKPVKASARGAGQDDRRAAELSVSSVEDERARNKI